MIWNVTFTQRRNASPVGIVNEDSHQEAVASARAFYGTVRVKGNVLHRPTYAWPAETQRLCSSCHNRLEPFSPQGNA